MNKTTVETITQLIQGIALGFIFLGLFGLGSAFYPIVSSEISYEIRQFMSNQGWGEDPGYVPEPAVQFSNVVNQIPPTNVKPVNTTNSILIEKINVNVPVVWDVSVINEVAYNQALKKGVAHAYGTQYPLNKNGNTYLFAHSTLNPLEIEKYAASFTLLHRLENGDKIIVYKDNNRYDYLVTDISIVDDFNTEPLTRKPDTPTLTLQTCDPPGIPLNRLIVTARLISHYELPSK